MSDGRLVVSDFGLATDADPTASSIHGGTVAYMAPEIARGERASVASDVWALGVIVHEIVFGRRPVVARGPLRLDDDGRRRRARWRPPSAASSRSASAARTSAAASARRPPRSARSSRAPRSPTRPARAGRRAPSSPPSCARRRVPLWRRRTSRGRRRSPWRRALAIASRARPPTGRATARVLTTVDGRVHALTALPGGARVRVTWGEPRRTEDVDLVDGRARARAVAAARARTRRARPPSPPTAPPSPSRATRREAGRSSSSAPPRGAPASCP